MREPTIRKVEKSDIQALAEKANEIWHEYFIPIIGLEQVEYMIDKYQSVKGLTQQINEGYSYYFVLIITYNNKLCLSLSALFF